MADSEDEFGDDLDDEALLRAVENAEHPDATAEDSRRKRPRLEGPDRGQEDGHGASFDLGNTVQVPPRTIGGHGRHGRYSDGRGSHVNQPFEIGSQENPTEGAWNGEWRLRGPQSNLRQTTLFGQLSSMSAEDSSQPAETRYNWPMRSKAEPPTHHQLNHDELRTWVYPTNIGSIRDYQYNIVSRGLYHNILVALPTGLGKTFIAATIMLNWYRWTQSSQIVFVAPTRPLVSQQVDACFKIAGIPRSQTTMLTGGIQPGIRAEEWSEKRVFFMTPQTIINDLKAGICDPKRIVLLVVDEAHRATGAYAYVEVVKFMRRFNSSFRVLALTATPGSTVEGVQEVIDGLGISRVEIRHEDSLDIRQYVHQRNIETTVFEYSEEIIMCMDMMSKALQPLVNKVKGQNAYWSNNPMTLTAFGCMQALNKWLQSDAGRNASWGIKGMIRSTFPILAGFAHAIELLKFHGIGPFYHKLISSESEKGQKKSHNQVFDNENYRKMMSRIKVWVNDRDFVGHPKLEALRSVALNHFMDAGEGRQEGNDQISPARTRIMVFAHFRDSAEEIVRVLKRNEPMVRPHVFVGQANSKGSEGMDQKSQLDVIDKFRRGVYNTLVATSIGEEGLDIGEVDLIICYDAHASPIRMLQRMGRTGRKRAGRIEVLLMKDKEYDNFLKARDNYEKMQEMIASGKRFTFHDEISQRIVPRDVQPVVEKRVVEIPPENTQADLPEPKRRGRAPKKPPKKFHYPDNARLGFTTASSLTKSDGGQFQQASLRTSLSPEPVPPNNMVLLTEAQTKELERVYQSVSGEDTQVVEPPRLDAHPSAQRKLRPTGSIGHGQRSRSLQKMLSAMHKLADPFAKLEYLEENLHPDDQRMVDRPNHETRDLVASSMENVGTAPAASGITLGSDTDDGDLYINEDYGSDLVGFINDEASEAEASTVSSASSPPVVRATKAVVSQSPSQEITLTQRSVSTSPPDLDSFLHPEKYNVAEEQAPLVSRRRRQVVDSDSEDLE